MKENFLIWGIFYSMDFTSSVSFPNEPLISWTFLDHFCHHFWVGLVLLCCCTHPKVMTKMAKNCLTDQSCIRKEITSYKIHTLVVVTCVSIRKSLDVFSNSHFKIFWSYELVEHIDNWGPFTVSNLVKNLWNLRSIYYRAQDMWITSFPKYDSTKIFTNISQLKNKISYLSKKGIFS